MLVPAWRPLPGLALVGLGLLVLGPRLLPDPPTLLVIKPPPAAPAPACQPGARPAAEGTDPRWLVGAPLRGRGYHGELVSRLPEEPAWAEALSLYLDAGPLRCGDVGPRAGCAGDGEPELADLADDAGPDDPCLRRRVVLWALEQLRQESLEEQPRLAEQLLRIARLPDAVLAGAVLETTLGQPRVHFRAVQAVLEAQTTPAALADAIERLADDQLRTLALGKTVTEQVTETLMKRPASGANCRALAYRLEQPASRQVRLALVDSLGRCGAVPGARERAFEVLLGASGDRDCRHQARAAFVLARHFEYGPPVPPKATAPLLERLCHHAADLDPVRREAALRGLLADGAQHWTRLGSSPQDEWTKQPLTTQTLGEMGEALGESNATKLPADHRLRPGRGGRTIERIEVTSEHSCGC